MKKNRLFYCIIFTVICQVLTVLVGTSGAYAGVNDFEFESFEADYYLTKDAEGVSHLRVDEKVVALFPEYQQNKGICRQIPLTNQDGANVTLPALDQTNIVVTRNGVAEPIYSISREGNYYNVCTGTDEYVLGRQEYRFQYEYERVVTEFPGYQELYWDTNGTGAMQEFGSVTARVHFADMDWWTGESWCYVGRYGERGSDRCSISRISDGVEFTARHIGSYENLTYDVELVAGSFVVPEPIRNYILVVTLAIFAVLIGAITAFRVKKLRGVQGKWDFYKGYFVKPEYQVPKDYDVAEMAEIYLGKKKDAKVAVMLDMIVKKKIRLVRRDKKKWAIEVLDAEALDDGERTLLEILNGGDAAITSDEIELKTQLSTGKLMKLGKQYESDLTANLKRDGLVEDKYKVGRVRTVKTGWWDMVDKTLTFGCMWAMVAVPLQGNLTEEAVGYLVGQNWFIVIFAMMMGAGTTVIVKINEKVRACEYLTMDGLKQSRYMDGLKLYIKMAEAERMKLLQSVDGVDVSADGVVRIYEKLLPYAAVFGLEKSWMKELQEYCKVHEIEEPEWSRGYSMTDVLFASNLATNYAVQSSSFSSSSGGSGGGGGGSSGGGGGGGGFSGR